MHNNNFWSYVTSLIIQYFPTFQERIGEYLSSSRDTKAVGRRPFDKMATLLAYLGPPEHRAVDTQFLVRT